jgi:hypothetical protein
VVSSLLKISEKGVVVGRYERPIIRWPKISAFYFEDVPNEKQFSKLTIEYSHKRKTEKPFPRLN